MSTIDARISTKTKRAKSTPSIATGKSRSTDQRGSQRSTTAIAKADGEAHATRVTKHDRVLALLSQREGATIPEIMKVTNWQQHSVRGFLAGTVRKKLGFALTSSKAEGELRRYRVDTKRGR